MAGILAVTRNISSSPSESVDGVVGLSFIDEILQVIEVENTLRVYRQCKELHELIEWKITNGLPFSEQILQRIVPQHCDPGFQISGVVGSGSTHTMFAHVTRRSVVRVTFRVANSSRYRHLLGQPNQVRRG